MSRQWSGGGAPLQRWFFSAGTSEKSE